MNGNLIKLLNGVKVSKKADDGTNIWGDPEHHRMIKVQKWTTAAAASSLPKLAASTVAAVNQSATPMSAPVLTGGLKSPILGASASEQQSSNADLFNPSTTSGTTGSGSPTSAVTTPSSAPVTSTTPPSWMAPTVAASVNKPTSSWNNTPAAAPPLLQQQQLLQQQLLAANGESNATGGDEIRSWHDRDSMSAGGGADQSQAHHHMQQKPWISNSFREVCFK